MRPSRRSGVGAILPRRFLTAYRSGANLPNKNRILAQPARLWSQTLFLCTHGMIATLLKNAWLAVLAALWLTGCATAPTQEMSDARQSVQAAHEAGARDYAAHNLKVAVDYLE